MCFLRIKKPQIQESRQMYNLRDKCNDSTWKQKQWAGKKQEEKDE